MNKLLEEQGQAAGADRRAQRWELDRQVEIAMDALRCPPADADVTKLSGGEKRRVALCRLLLESPTCCCSTNRRTTSTPRASRGSSSFLADVPGHGRRDHARSLLPRQRREVDPRARSRRGHPVRGQLLGLARAEAEAAGARGEEGQRHAQRDARARARVGADVAARAAGQEQGAHPGVRGDAGEEQQAKVATDRDRDPAARRGSATRS